MQQFTEAYKDTEMGQAHRHVKKCVQRFTSMNEKIFCENKLSNKSKNTLLVRFEISHVSRL